MPWVPLKVGCSYLLWNIDFFSVFRFGSQGPTRSVCSPELPGRQERQVPPLPRRRPGQASGHLHQVQHQLKSFLFANNHGCWIQNASVSWWFNILLQLHYLVDRRHEKSSNVKSPNEKSSNVKSPNEKSPKLELGPWQPAAGVRALRT